MAGSLIVRGNKYYAKFRVDGKQKMCCLNITAKGNNKRKAEKAMQELISSFDGLDITKGNTLFVSFLNVWLNEMKGLLKPTTWETYDKTVHGKIIPYFTNRKYRVIDLTPKIFTEYFMFLSTEGKSNGCGGLGLKSVKNIRGVVSSALDYAVKNRYILNNPVTDSRLPVFEKDLSKEVTQYSSEEVKRLLDYAKEHESHIYIFILLALVTGMRKGEICALTWNDIDYEKKVLTINKSRSGSRSGVTSVITTPKTVSSNRTIPLTDFTIKELKYEQHRQEVQYGTLIKAESKDSNYIVRTIDGRPYCNLSAINRVVSRLIKGAGLKHCTIHGFRHSVASILDDNGVALQDISVLLGHENTSTTENIYIQRRRKARPEVTQKLDYVLNLK